jgi:Flp pilus assembly protein CpaB
MKNSIPLILAVVLGLAAVFAVGRVISSNIVQQEEMIEVVAAQRDIPAGEVLADGFYRPKKVPRSALPAQAILWNKAQMLNGQTLLINKAAGDYIYLSDFQTQGIGNVVGEGEWAVAIQLPSRSIATMLKPGDEVAIIATFQVEEKKAEAESGDSQKTKEVTTVLFPRVRVLEIGGGLYASDQSGTLVLQLPPQQAQTLIAASRVASLYPALRRPNDTSALNRLDAGVVDMSTFRKLLEGQETVVVPKIPNAGK